MGGVPAVSNGLLAHLPHVSHPRWQGSNAYSKGTNRVFFGDREEIAEDVIHRLIDIQDEIALNHAWMDNDLLVLDNTRVMHGRRKAEAKENARSQSLRQDKARASGNWKTGSRQVELEKKGRCVSALFQSTISETSKRLKHRNFCSGDCLGKDD